MTLPTIEQARSWRGLTLVATDDEPVGRIEAIYVDRTTRQPEWALVHTGLFGSSRTFVPLADAAQRGDTVQVPHETSVVREAPRLEQDTELSEEDEARLYAHYGPDWIESPDDIAYIYLDLVETLGLRQTPTLGCSFGGWLALEMATKHDGFCSKLVLAAPYGVKIGGPADRDIQDPWNIHPSKAAELKWFDPEKGKRDFGAMPERELTVVARNNESFARFCWDPCLHNPKLKQRLHRVRVPTLFVWGEHDGIVTPDYGKAFSRMIPQARFAIVEQAGHYPHLEQPAKFLTLVQDFLS